MPKTQAELEADLAAGQQQLADARAEIERLKKQLDPANAEATQRRIDDLLSEMTRLSQANKDLTNIVQEMNNGKGSGGGGNNKPPECPFDPLTQRDEFAQWTIQQAKAGVQQESDAQKKFRDAVEATKKRFLAKYPHLAEHMDLVTYYASLRISENPDQVKRETESEGFAAVAEMVEKRITQIRGAGAPAPTPPHTGAGTPPGGAGGGTPPAPPAPEEGETTEQFIQRTREEARAKLRPPA